MDNKKLNKYLTKEFRKIGRDLSREKARCARLYSDWRDDEFNMLDNFFIWGYNVNKNVVPSFYSWDDAYIYYNRITKKYIMTIDTGFYDAEYSEELARGEVKRLVEIDFGFRDFLLKNDLLIIEPVFPYNDPTLEADTLPQLYFKFKIMLEGYKQFLR